MDTMRTMAVAILFGVVLSVAGCAHPGCQVYLYNGTPALVTDTRVKLAKGDTLSFGVLDPAVDKGIWPVIGPFGGESTVEWTDARQVKKSAKAVVDRKFLDDSIIFLINSNDTVTVETGRGLYGHKRR